MSSLIFSQASIFHLYRLGLVVSGKTGKKFSLSNEQQMLELIKLGDRSSDIGIHRQFGAFMSTIEPHIVSQMESRGIVRHQERMTETPRLQEKLLSKRAG